MIFKDRREAGQQLGAALAEWKDARPVVLGLARRGVEVAVEVARALEAPLDLWVVQKVSAPGHPELGLGAVAEGGSTYVDQTLLQELGLDENDAAKLLDLARTEVSGKASQLRRSRPRPDLTGRTVILVDDGIAMGGTARVALRDIERMGPQRLVLAVPVASTHALQMLRREADDVVCLEAATELSAISAWYEDFSPVSTEACARLVEDSRRFGLDQAQADGRLGTVIPSLGAGDRQRLIRTDDADLPSTLNVPPGARGVVLFAHGSGSTRFSTRNNAVARRLQRAGLGTLLMDLLTEYEQELDGHGRGLAFDVDLLAQRLLAATDWLIRSGELRGLPLGYFGASTGAAAALAAAARRPEAVSALVARGGRPDLAVDSIPDVRAPTLLVVGGEDPVVLDLNRRALRWFNAHARLVVIPGATHLFEEPGALQEVARLASEWFTGHLGRPETAHV